MSNVGDFGWSPSSVPETQGMAFQTQQAHYNLHKAFLRTRVLVLIILIMYPSIVRCQP